MSAFKLNAEVGFVISSGGVSALKAQLQRSLGGLNANIDLKVSADTVSRLGTLNSTLAKVTTNLRDIAALSTTASAGLSKLASSFTGASTSSSRAAQGVTSLNRSLQRTGQAGRHAASVSEQLSVGFEKASRHVITFTVAAQSLYHFVHNIRHSVSEAIKFERELVRVAQVAGDSRAAVKGIGDEVSRLATTLGVDAHHLLDASKLIRQAGFSINETKTALEALAQADLSGTFHTMEDTAKGAVSVMKQFNIETKDLGATLSSINQVAGQFGASSGEILHAVEHTGEAFKAAGGNIHELIGLFATVKGTTQEATETIATGLRTIFQRVQRPEVLDQLDALNIHLRRTKEEAEQLGDTSLERTFVGPLEAVKRLSEALEKIHPNDPRFAQVGNLLGGPRQVQRLIPLLEQVKRAQDAVNVATYGGGSLTRSASQAQDTFAVKLEKVREQFDLLIRKVVDSNGFKGLTDSLVKVAEAFVKITDYAKPLVPLFTVLATAKIGQGLVNFAAPKFGRPAPFVSPTQQQLPRLRFAQGGHVPGQGDTDSVDASVTPGEFVLRKSAVRKLGKARLDFMNKTGEIPHFDGGGEYVNGTYAGGGLFSLLRRGLHYGHLAFKATYATHNMGQSAAEAVALERGMTEAGAKRLRRYLTIADTVGVKASQASFPLTGALAAPLSFVPLASSAYLGYATATDPLATLRAALKGGKSLYGLAERHGVVSGESIIRSLQRVGLTHFAGGGVVPGTGDTDSVPMHLAEGSFVVRKKSARSIGYENLSKMAGGGEAMANAITMPGEYVFPPEDVKRIGLTKLRQINQTGRLPHFAEGDLKGADFETLFPLYQKVIRQTVRKLGGAANAIGGADEAAQLANIRLFKLFQSGAITDGPDFVRGHRVATRGQNKGKEIPITNEGYLRTTLVREILREARKRGYVAAKQVAKSGPQTRAEIDEEEAEATKKSSAPKKAIPLNRIQTLGNFDKEGGEDPAEMLVAKEQVDTDIASGLYTKTGKRAKNPGGKRAAQRVRQQTAPLPPVQQVPTAQDVAVSQNFIPPQEPPKPPRVAAGDVGPEGEPPQPQNRGLVPVVRRSLTPRRPTPVRFNRPEDDIINAEFSVRHQLRYNRPYEVPKGDPNDFLNTTLADPEADRYQREVLSQFNRRHADEAQRRADRERTGELRNELRDREKARAHRKTEHRENADPLLVRAAGSVLGINPLDAERDGRRRQFEADISRDPNLRAHDAALEANRRRLEGAAKRAERQQRSFLSQNDPLRLRDELLRRVREADANSLPGVLTEARSSGLTGASLLRVEQAGKARLRQVGAPGLERANVVDLFQERLDHAYRNRGGKNLLSEGTQERLANREGQKLHAEIAATYRRQIKALHSNISSYEANQKATEHANRVTTALSKALEAKAKEENFSLATTKALTEEEKHLLRAEINKERQITGTAGLSGQLAAKGLAATTESGRFEKMFGRVGLSGLGRKLGNLSRQDAFNVHFALSSATSLFGGVLENAGGTAQEELARGGSGSVFGRFGGFRAFGSGIQGAATGAVTASLITGNPLAIAATAAAGAVYQFTNSVKESAEEIRQVRIGNAAERLGRSLENLSAGKEDVTPHTLGEISKDLGEARRRIDEGARKKATGFFNNFDEKVFEELRSRELSGTVGTRETVVTNFLNRQAREVGKENPNKTVEEFQKILKEGGNGVNLEFLRLISELEHLPLANVLKNFAKVAADAATAERQRLSAEKSNETVAHTFTAFGRISSVIDAASRRAEVFEKQLATLGNTIEGHIAPSPLPDLARGLQNLASPDRGAFRTSLAGLTGPLGERGTAFGTAALAHNDVASVLPLALARTLSGGFLGEGDVGLRLRQQLHDLLPNRNEQSNRVIELGVHELNRQGAEKLFTESGGDVSRIASQVLAPHAQIVSDFAQPAVKALGAQQNRFVSGLAHLSQLALEQAKILAEANRLELSAVRQRANIRAIAQNRRNDVESFLNLSQLERPFNQGQVDLTKLPEVQALSPAALGAALKEVTDRIPAAQENLFKAASSGRDDGGKSFREAAQEFNKLNSSSSRLQAALRNLTNVAERAAGVQERLNNLARDRESRLGAAEHVAGADFGEVSRINRGLALAHVAKTNGRGLDQFVPQDRALILSSLNLFRDAKLPGFGNIRASDLKNQLLGGFAGGAFQQTPEDKNEEKTLNEKLLGYIEDGKRAAEELFRSRELLQSKFFTDLTAANKQFLSDLKNLEKTKFQLQEKTTELGDAGRNLGRLRELTPHALTLARFGVTTDAEREKFQANESEIRQFVTNTGNIQKLSNLSRAFQTSDKAEGIVSQVFGEGDAEKTRRFFRHREHSDTFINTLTDAGFAKEDVEAIRDSLQKRAREAVGRRSNVSPAVLLKEAVAEASENRIGVLRENDVETLPGGAKRFRSAELRSRLGDQAFGALGAAAVQGGSADELFNSLKKFNKENPLDGFVDKLDKARKNFDDLSASVNALRRSLSGEKTDIKQVRDQFLRGGLNAIGLPAQRHAMGGIVSPDEGPRGTDTVLSWLSPSEFVVNAASARANMDLLYKINESGGKRVSFGGEKINLDDIEKRPNHPPEHSIYLAKGGMVAERRYARYLARVAAYQKRQERAVQRYQERIARRQELRETAAAESLIRSNQAIGALDKFNSEHEGKDLSPEEARTKRHLEGLRSYREAIYQNARKLANPVRTPYERLLGRAGLEQAAARRKALDERILQKSGDIAVRRAGEEAGDIPRTEPPVVKPNAGTIHIGRYSPSSYIKRLAGKYEDGSSSPGPHPYRENVTQIRPYAPVQRFAEGGEVHGFFRRAGEHIQRAGSAAKDFLKEHSRTRGIFGNIGKIARDILGPVRRRFDEFLEDHLHGPARVSEAIKGISPILRREALANPGGASSLFLHRNDPLAQLGLTYASGLHNLQRRQRAAHRTSPFAAFGVTLPGLDTANSVAVAGLQEKAQHNLEASHRELGYQAALRLAASPQALGFGRARLHFAQGGVVPGDDRTDSTSINVSAGEYILPRDSVRNLGGPNAVRRLEQNASQGNLTRSSGSSTDGKAWGDSANKFAASVTQLVAVTNAFQSSTKLLQHAFEAFGNHARGLGDALKNMPSKLQMEVSGRQELYVIHNGQEVFATLEPKLKEYVGEKVNSALRELMKKKLPDA